MFRNVLLRPWASFCASALSPEAMYRGTIGTARFCAITLPETRRMSSTVGSPVDSSRIQSNGASPARLDPSFQQHAEELLQSLVDALERPSYHEAIESVELSGDGVLEIVLTKERGTIVLNKHYVHKQIWYSAPDRPPDYFDYDFPALQWVSQRTQTPLMDRLGADLTALTGINIFQQ